MFRSSHPEGKHQNQSVVLGNGADCEPATFIKRDSETGVFL